MIFDEVPTELLDKACAVVRMSETIGIDYVTDMLGAWIAKDPNETARVMVALARLADENKYLRQAHAAYARGDRTPAVVELERRYQRLRKSRNRNYQLLQTVDTEEEATA